MIDETDFTGYQHRFWPVDVIFAKLECVGVKRVLLFLENDSTNLHQIFNFEV